MLLCEHFSRSLKTKWTRYEKKLKDVKKRASSEAVHDARVSIRRLLSLLNILDALFPSRGLSACQRALKEQLELFSALRDVHIQMELIKDMLSSCPELNPFYNSLLQQEQKAVKQIRKHLAGAESDAIKAARESLTAKLSMLASDTSFDMTARLLALGTAAAAFVRVMRLRARVDPSDTETVHRMRVAFKHFRYMRETLHPHIVRLNRAQADALHDFQTLLGNLQDVEVLMENFNGFLKKMKLPQDAFLSVHMAFFKKRMALLTEILSRAGEEMEIFGKPVFTQIEKARRKTAEPLRNAKGEA